MISPKELRIGNKVLHVDFPENEYQVIDITLQGARVQKLSNMTSVFLYSTEMLPIPITEHRLIEAGFEKHGAMPSLEYCKGNLILSVLVTTFMLGIEERDDLSPLWVKKVEHWHHLQNLVFFLTGKELEG